MDEIIKGLVTALLDKLFQDNPYTLWAIKLKDGSTTQYEAAWHKIGTGSKGNLEEYARELFAEGWRTLIIATGITPIKPPDLGPKEG